MTAALAVPPAFSFDLPPGSEAHEPPEARGLARDGVRLMVSRGTEPPTHHRFTDLPALLDPGDLLVVNTSATLPASLPGRLPDATAVDLHLSTALLAGLWLVELRHPAAAGGGRFTGEVGGQTVALPGGAGATLVARYPGSARLWVAALDLPAPVPPYLAVHGRPIRYRHVAGDWPLSAYQTVYATEAGSAEMPSAGRPFTTAVVTSLVAAGIGVTPVVLHCGVASLERGEEPPPEPYAVPAVTAQRVNATRAAGGRVIAVGTTVVRALETVADEAGTAHPGRGWTDLVVTPEGGVRAVDGLLTGWHEPEASHLLLLEAIAPRAVLEDAYRVALAAGYLWHEFGDLHLLLP